MYLLHDVPLSGYSTMRLGGLAAHLTEVSSREEIIQAIDWANEKQLPVIMIGIGSNIVWSDKGFPGLVLVNKIMRYETFEEDSENVYITAGGGEIWDSVVERTVDSGLSGIEALSLIPGTVGATPVQNVGAYGQEIADTLVSIETYDNQTKSFGTIASVDCGFGYRTSRFKTTDKGRFFITAVTLHLTRTAMKPPFYKTLQTYLTENNITDHSPASIRRAVIAIRSSKLPDPSLVANNGSFFANPVVNAAAFAQLRANYPDITYWETDNGQYKLSAAWLVEQAGFKDVHDPETGMATWAKQALVFVNEHANSTADLLRFKTKIVDKVQAIYGVTLVQEPELIGEI